MARNASRAGMTEVADLVVVDIEAYFELILKHAIALWFKEFAVEVWRQNANVRWSRETFALPIALLQNRATLFPALMKSLRRTIPLLKSTSTLHYHVARQYNSNRPCDPLRVLYCGSDEFSAVSLRAVHEEHCKHPELIKSIDVVCRPDKRTGRGLKEIRQGEFDMS